MRKCLLLIVSVLASAAFGTPASAIQCVPYAREVSGINLKGDAWQWWNAASGVYDRGRAPKDGAVLVFTRQGSMRHGHVSVVTRVISNRLVLVDHANWAPARASGRGEVTTAVPVLDVSPKNDWTQVRVWFQPSADFGSRIYRTEGYVYQPRDPRVHRPAVHQVALRRANEIFPKEHHPVHGAVALPKMETSRSEAAAPKVEAIAAEAALKAAPIVAQPAAAATTPAAAAEDRDEPPLAEGMVKVAKHMFRPRPQVPAAADVLLFN